MQWREFAGKDLISGKVQAPDCSFASMSSNVRLKVSTTDTPATFLSVIYKPSPHISVLVNRLEMVAMDNRSTALGRGVPSCELSWLLQHLPLSY